MIKQRNVSCFIAAWLALIVSDALAADAGTVLFARGEVTAEREPPVPLAKGDSVLDDDTVATGDASRAQLLLLDGAKIAIRPNSRLRIDEYVFQGAPATETGQGRIRRSPPVPQMSTRARRARRNGGAGWPISPNCP